MREYKYAIAALSICPIHFGYSENEYKERFKTFLHNSEPSYTDLIRKDIKEALNDSEWSWKEAAKEVEFYGYEERYSEEDVLRQVKWLMWDTLFPEEK